MDTTSKTRLWTKDFITITLVSFLIAFIFLLTVTTITEYALEKFHASQSYAGLAASIFVIGLLSARLFVGKYLEILGRKKLLYIGLISSLIISLVYFPVENLSLFIIVRFLHGVGVGISFSVIQTSVLDLIPPQRRGEGISYYSISFVLATAIGPLLGVFILQYSSMSMVFIVCTAVSLLSILLTLPLTIPEVELTNEQLEEMKKFQFSDFFEKKVFPISLIMGIFAYSYSSVLSFLASYTEEINLISGAIFFFLVYSIFIFISRPFTGKLLDTRGDNIVMYPSILCFATGLLVMSQAANSVTLLLAGALIGLGYGNLLSATQTIAVKIIPRYRAGLATSTFFIFVETGVGIGPFILGYFVPIIGFRNMYLVLAVIVFASLFFYYFLHGKKAYKKQITNIHENNSV
ncbi:MFS transporter [Bacillus sp. B15-48]|uniref:MFS transporter n=1 Tax=Bacillus sp. B15-48 TaxID=1548601 RepID=UPI00193EF285|nr:MFS transporter [Bacillus sp. B15-48]MBM4763379.1 MFS transporter [Bacillus sp. B15-48]